MVAIVVNDSAIMHYTHGGSKKSSIHVVQLIATVAVLKDVTKKLV